MTVNLNDNVKGGSHTIGCKHPKAKLWNGCYGIDITKGLWPGGTQINSIGKSNGINDCLMIAKEQGYPAWGYRNEKHPNSPNTCFFYTNTNNPKGWSKSMKSNLKDISSHVIGCTNPYTELKSGCIKVNNNTSLSSLNTTNTNKDTINTDTDTTNVYKYSLSQDYMLQCKNITNNSSPSSVTTGVESKNITNNSSPPSVTTGVESKNITNKSIPYLGGIYSLIGGQGGKYCADDVNDGINCNRDQMLKWEQFIIEPQGNNKYYIKGGRGGKYCADDANGINCNRDQALDWEKFTIEPIGDNKYSIKGGRGGKYCSDDVAGKVICNRDKVDKWEKFILTKL
jgi:hypothetical protein